MLTMAAHLVPWEGNNLFSFFHELVAHSLRGAVHSLGCERLGIIWLIGKAKCDFCRNTAGGPTVSEPMLGPTSTKMAFRQKSQTFMGFGLDKAGVLHRSLFILLLISTTTNCKQQETISDSSWGVTSINNQKCFGYKHHVLLFFWFYIGSAG